MVCAFFNYSSMTRTNLLLLLIFSIPLLTSCCNEDNVEVARYELTQYELELIPYTLGQKVVFEHSNGYEFNAYVEEIATEWQQYFDFCEWNCCGQDYFSYQTKRVFLVSSYPNLRMRFRLNESIYSDYTPRIFISISTTGISYQFRTTAWGIFR